MDKKESNPLEIEGFVEEIERYLEEKKISPEELAEEASITGRGLRDIIQRKTKNPGLRTIMRLFQAMGRTPQVWR